MKLSLINLVAVLTIASCAKEDKTLRNLPDGSWTSSQEFYSVKNTSQLAGRSSSHDSVFGYLFRTENNARTLEFIFYKARPTTKQYNVVDDADNDDNVEISELVGIANRGQTSESNGQHISVRVDATTGKLHIEGDQIELYSYDFGGFSKTYFFKLTEK